MIQIFENRYDNEYLKQLSDLLDFNNLMTTAVETGEYNFKTYKPRNAPPQTLKHAVKIDFCGLASTTLLGITPKEFEEDIKAANPENFREILRLRQEIHNKFRLLLSPNKLKELNKAGKFLQIRFCFSYLYSDFPINLMRAEDSRIWDARMDNEVAFSKNAAMTVDEWKNSFMYRSQEASLRAIAQLCTASPDLARTREYDKAINTLETRFAVIPTPQSVLIINDVAISDAYMYAKVTKGNHLSVSCPVNMVKDPGKAYELLRQHFLYTWRHDLTMYADMCTNYKSNDPAGLTELLPPIKPGTEKDPNIDWQKKINRIIQRRKDLYSNYNPYSPEEKRHIEIWHNNVKEKMAMSTRKMRETPAELDPSGLSIEIGYQNSKYYIKMKYGEEDIFNKSRTVPGIGYCAIAHYAFAKKTKCNPRLYKTIHLEPKEFKRSVVNWLESGMENKNGFTAEILFKALFDTGQGRVWEFFIPDENIRFNTIATVSKAAYKDPNGQKITCFSGLNAGG